MQAVQDLIVNNNQKSKTYFILDVSPLGSLSITSNDI